MPDHHARLRNLAGGLALLLGSALLLHTPIARADSARSERNPFAAANAHANDHAKDDHDARGFSRADKHAWSREGDRDRDRDRDRDDHRRDRLQRDPYVVNADDDRDGGRCTVLHCNLREAIQAANHGRGDARITFDLPAIPWRIVLEAPLPALRGRVHLLADRQPGTECPLPRVALDGSALTDRDADGLHVHGDGNVVRGLAIGGFGGHGVRVTGSGNTLACLHVGVDVDGLDAFGNGGHGIAVLGGHSNTVGGTDPADAVLASANGGLGLYQEDAIGTVFANVAIGTDALGNAKLPNGNADPGPLLPPAGASPIRDPAVLARVTQAFERRVQRILAQQAAALARSGLIDRFAITLKLDPPDPDDATAVRTFFRVLARDPDAYAAFTAAAANVVEQARTRTSERLARIRASASTVLPAFGRDAIDPGEERGDPLGELLASYAPDTYVVSGPPSQIQAVEFEDGPLVPVPLSWHSMQTYGPFSFNTPQSDLQFVRVCQSTTANCFWPIAYDFAPLTLEILWQSTLDPAEMEQVVTEQGWFLELRLNGQLLQKGPRLGFDPVPPGQSWYGATVPDEPCPANRSCVATSLLVRDRIAHIPKPWTFELRIRRLEPLQFPIIDGIDEFGNPILRTHTVQTVGTASRTVLANPETGHLAWFEEALYETFQHPRCTDCHGFGNFANLAAHHGYSDTAAFVTATGLHLEPSAYVPGAHVMNCNSCHQVPVENLHGVPFHEIVWIAPFQDLDVNWGQMNAQEICTRVKQNLPTEELRHDHFHGDARLFWAVQQPTPPTSYLEPAPPETHDEFLRRVDLWNTFGAPCP